MKKIHLDPSKPICATHFPSLGRREEFSNNIAMFTEDVWNGVMPIRPWTDKHKNLRVDLEGDRVACETAIRLLNGIDKYARQDSTRAVCGAVEQVAKSLSREGSAAYEILCTREEGKRLSEFTTRRLWKSTKHFFQIVPRKEWKTIDRKIITVPTDRVWYIEMPIALGGRRRYRNILRQLVKNEITGPDFWRKGLERGMQSRIFDYESYRLDIDICCWKATNRWGWNRRDWEQERTTEFFVFYRMISRTLAQAILREHIVNALNELFVRLGVLCNVCVDGLPTIGTIKRVRSEMVEGKISFNDVADQVML
ncbi:MAG: hypothetical protein OXG08_06455 [Gammaproteobacteria bacterium]|nr:hypothetical protein [Gammaproteobacteria bacterium]